MVTRIKRALQGAIVGLALGSSVASAALFNLFGPSTGVLVGNANSPQTSAAIAVNITGLFTGCTSSPTTVFLRADGTCAAPAGTAMLANPTGLIGLTAVNGTATTGTRSDGHPALDQSIAPTMTGFWNWTFAGSGGQQPYLFNDNRISPATPAVVIEACCSGTIVLPQLSLQATPSQSTNGFATLSIAGTGPSSNLTVGTTDLSIFNGGSSFNSSIINNSGAGTLSIGAGGLTTEIFHTDGSVEFNRTTTFDATVVSSSTAANSFIAGTNLGGEIARFEAQEAITGPAHYGFLDDSQINMATSTNGHASFDSNVTFTGTGNWDHHHDYQAVMHLQSTGTVTDASSFWAGPQITGGTATNMYLFNGQAPVKSGGTIGTLYGLYIQPLTQGTVNWGVFVDGAEPSEFGGGLIVAGTKPSIASSAASLISIGANAGGTAQQWFIDSANSTNQKAWDLIVDTTACMSFRTITDDLATANPALQMCRSAATPTTISYNGVAMTPQTGTFTGTITGMTGTVTCTNTYYIIGKIATVILCSSGTGTGTSNATTLTMTGLPAVLQPAAIVNQDLPIAGAQDAGIVVVTTGNAFARVSASSGTLQFFKNGAGWTATGTKGIVNPSPITYLLN